VPELPEVETVRRGLAELIVSARIADVEMLGARTFRRVDDRDAFRAVVAGSTVSRVDRHGKYLLIGFAEHPAVELVIHLRMSGQLLWSSSRDGVGRPLHTHAVLHFDGLDGELRFVDPRTFGEWYLTTDRRELAHLGPDALVLASDPDAFAAVVGGTRAAVKPLLMDQRRVAGIGNIYADEIAHRARVRIDRPGSSLTRPARRRLAEATSAILGRAIELGGTTLDDEQYVDLFGQPGGAGGVHAVHARAGMPCPTCGRAITRTVIGGRSAYWCRTCQR
jgi:formamidopyrimidine-DNA glycosylase